MAIEGSASVGLAVSSGAASQAAANFTFSEGEQFHQAVIWIPGPVPPSPEREPIDIPKGSLTVISRAFFYNLGGAFVKIMLDDETVITTLLPGEACLISPQATNLKAVADSVLNGGDTHIHLIVC